MIHFDSRKEEYKTPFGCVECCQTVSLRLKISRRMGTIHAFLCLQKDAAETEKIPLDWGGLDGSNDVYEVSFVLPEMGLYFYFFKLITGWGEQVIYKSWDNVPIVGQGEKWQISCVRPGFVTPAKFHGAVMYQIFPDRFAAAAQPDVSDKLTPFWIHENKDDIPHFLPDEHGEILNNDFYGGNLRGIESKLDYIRSLGVSVIYLNPIFKAQSNHRYDTCDYKKIDPLLGSEEDFASLCRACRLRGISVILDGVFSHTGDNSVYFDRLGIFGQGAYHNENSPYRDWYNFTEYPHNYEKWWGIKTLPCVNELNQSFMNFILYDEDSVVKHWLRLGADGFRLDVADELPDQFIEELYKTVKAQNSAALVIGEVWEDASNKISYSSRRKYLLGNELDSVMNYVFKDAIVGFLKGTMEGSRFLNAVMQAAENYPEQVLHCLMNSLSTHDTKRIITELASPDGSAMSRSMRAQYVQNSDERERGENLVILASFLQFTLPGIPCIYYGDELGMQGYEDPFNRGYFTQKNPSNVIFAAVKAFAELKNTSAALRQGRVLPCFSDGEVAAYLRKLGSKRILCAVNKGTKSAEIPLSALEVPRKPSALYIRNGSVSDGMLILQQYGCAAIEL